MNRSRLQRILSGWAAVLVLTPLCATPALAGDLTLHALDYLDTQGLSVLAYQNTFHPVFRDQKMGGVEIILHGERIATGGEVRLQATPEQWDPVPLFTARKHGPLANQLVAYSGYPDLHLSYRIEVTAEGEGFRVAVTSRPAAGGGAARKGGLQPRIPAHGLFWQELQRG